MAPHPATVVQRAAAPHPAHRAKEIPPHPARMIQRAAAASSAAAAPAAAPANSETVTAPMAVTHIQQKGPTCISAAIDMVLDAHGKKKLSMNAGSKGEADNRSLALYAGLTYMAAKDFIAGSLWGALRVRLAKGPIIAGLDVPNPGLGYAGQGHAIVLVQASKNEVYYLDPNGPGLNVMSMEKLFELLSCVMYLG